MLTCHLFEKGLTWFITANSFGCLVCFVCFVKLLSNFCKQFELPKKISQSKTNFPSFGLSFKFRTFAGPRLSQPCIRSPCETATGRVCTYALALRLPCTLHPAVYPHSCPCLKPSWNRFPVLTDLCSFLCLCPSYWGHPCFGWYPRICVSPALLCQPAIFVCGLVFYPCLLGSFCHLGSPRYPRSHLGQPAWLCGLLGWRPAPLPRWPQLGPPSPLQLSKLLQGGAPSSSSNLCLLPGGWICMTMVGWGPSHVELVFLVLHRWWIFDATSPASLLWLSHRLYRSAPMFSATAPWASLSGGNKPQDLLLNKCSTSGKPCERHATMPSRLNVCLDPASPSAETFRPLKGCMPCTFESCSSFSPGAPKLKSHSREDGSLWTLVYGVQPVGSPWALLSRPAATPSLQCNSDTTCLRQLGMVVVKVLNRHVGLSGHSFSKLFPLLRCSLRLSVAVHLWDRCLSTVAPSKGPRLWSFPRSHLISPPWFFWPSATPIPPE